MSSFVRYTLSALLLAMVVLLAACSQKSDSKTEAADSPGNGVQAEPADSLQITLIGSDSTSVLDLLKASHDVDAHQSTMGAFVKGIDSVENGEGHFWLYSVNDSAGKVAADKYLTSDSDVVVWHYRKIGE